MLFSEFLADFVDSQPFNIDFDFRPSKRKRGKVIEIIEGISVPIYRGVSVNEKLFYDALEQKNEQHSLELRLEMKLMGVKFQEYITKNRDLQKEIVKEIESKFILEDDEKITADTFADDLELLERWQEATMKVEFMQIKDMADAIGILFSPKQVLQDAKDTVWHSRYTMLMVSVEGDKFVKDNKDGYEHILNLGKLTQTKQSFDWLTATVFLQSRYDREWSFDDTGTLTTEELEIVAQWINHERNKGKDPLPYQAESLSDEESIKKT